MTNNVKREQSKIICYTKYRISTGKEAYEPVKVHSCSE